MVTFFKKTVLPLTMFFTLFITGCNVDLLGAFISTDIDERLKEQNNLHFIKKNAWENLDALPEEYSFLIVNDLHIENGNVFDFDKLPEMITAYNLNTAHPPIEFIVTVGDITQTGAEKDLRKFIEIAESMNVPCYPVIGNHDIYFGNWSQWKTLIGSTQYRIDGANTSLIMLDSANSFFGKQQLNWLQNELKTVNEHVFVFTHSSLFAKGPAEMQQITDMRERAHIISILKDTCDIMFMGHSHVRNINKIGNTHFVTVEDFKGKKTFCIVTVRNSGISYEFKNL